MFKKFFHILIAIILLAGIGMGAWLILSRQEGIDFLIPKKKIDQEKALEMARTWILENSPTYRFDGYELMLLEVKPLECSACYQLVFSFLADFDGYGDRSDELIIQALTSHTMILNIEQDRVVYAVTDEIYDELNKIFLNKNNKDEEKRVF